MNEMQPKVLLLQDQESIMRLWQLMLQNHNVATLRAYTSQDVANMLREGALDGIEVAVLDFHLGEPFANGLDAAKMLRNLHPILPIISGSNSEGAFRELSNPRVVEPSPIGDTRAIVALVLAQLAK